MISYAFRKTSEPLDAYMLELKENAAGLSSSVSELQDEQQENGSADLGEEIQMMRNLVAELKEDVSELIRSGGNVGRKTDAGVGEVEMDMMRREVEVLKESVQSLNKGDGKRCPGYSDGGPIEA